VNGDQKGQIGLVFSGGGGKGAYQIGVWKALRELGIESGISHVSGTSVGALNACFFSMGELDKAISAWNSISTEDILSVDTAKIGAWVAKIGTLGIINSIAESTLRLFGKNRSDGFFSRHRLEQLIEHEIDFHAIQNSIIKTYATCLQKSTLSATSFNLNLQSKETIKAVLLATSAIPVVFESHAIGEQEYFDGGLVDNTPIRPLYEDGVRNFIIVYLSQSAVVPHDSYPGAKFLEIVPQRDMGNLLKGTLNFNQQTIQERMIDGYTDAMKILMFYKHSLMYENTLNHKVIEITNGIQQFDYKNKESFGKLEILKTKRKDLLNQLKAFNNEEI